MGAADDGLCAGDHHRIERESIGWVAIVGIGAYMAGFMTEVVADRLKSAFKRDPANDGRFIVSCL